MNILKLAPLIFLTLSLACGPQGGGQDDDDDPQSTETPRAETPTFPPGATPTTPGATAPEGTTPQGTTPQGTPPLVTPPPTPTEAAPTQVPSATLAANPALFRLDDLKAGCGWEGTTFVTNTSSSPINLIGALVQGASDRAEISVELATGVLDPSQTTTVTITVNALTVGELDARVQLISQNAPTVAAEIPLLGQIGELGGGATERFTQTAWEKTDILWMIDNSGSMGDDHHRLSNAFSVFSEHLTQSQTHYHLGLSIFGQRPGPQAGHLVGQFNNGEVYVENSLGIDGLAAFASEIGELNADSVSAENGLEVMEWTLSDPALTGYNAGFLRSDAKLAVIFMSDEPDDSMTVSNALTYPTLYSDFLITLKGGNENLRAAGLFSYDDYYGSGDFPAYDEVISNTGGLSLELGANASDLEAEIEALAAVALGLDWIFPLTMEPDEPDEIHLTVDGERVYEGLTTWRYDPAHNAIHFSPAAIPPHGSVIVVSLDGSAQTCD